MTEFMRVIRGIRIYRMKRDDAVRQMGRDGSGRSVRLYCAMHNQSWQLQVRGPLGVGCNGQSDGKDFVIAGASMSRDDLIALRNAITDHLRPIGSSSADNPDQPADNEQIAGRIDVCLGNMAYAAKCGGAVDQVERFAAEVRGLVRVLSEG